MGDIDLTSKEKEELVNWFVLKITQAGTNQFSSDFKKWEGNNAVKIITNAVYNISENMVGTIYKPDLIYKVACNMLRPLKFNRDELFNDIDNVELGKEYTFPKKSEDNIKHN